MIVLSIPMVSTYPNTSGEEEYINSIVAHCFIT